MNDLQVETIFNEKTPMEICLKQAEELQQKFYELSPDWSEYKIEDSKYLKLNIAYAIFNQEVITEKEINDNKEHDLMELVKITKEMEQVVDSIQKLIIECSKISEDTKLLVNIIFNVIIENSNSIQEPNCLSIPIFRIKGKDENILFIDASARVYNSWHDYKTSNKLQPCIMILPVNGCYQYDPTKEIFEDYSRVWIEIVESPSSLVSEKVLKAIDTTSTITGLLGGLGLLTAAFTPIAPIALIGFGVTTTVASGLWTVGRSTAELVDRSNHKQSISFKEREARRQWFGVVGGASGVLTGAVTGSATLLSIAAQRGWNISRAAKLAHNTLIATDIVTHGSNVGIGIFDLVVNWDENDKKFLSIAGTCINCMFFGMAIRSANFASDIIENSQRMAIQEFQSNLKNSRHRKAFRKMVKKINGSEITDKNQELIRSIKKFSANKKNVTIPEVKINVVMNSKRFKNTDLFIIDGVILIKPESTVEMVRTECRNFEENQESHTTLTDVGKKILNIINEVVTLSTGKRCSTEITFSELEVYILEMQKNSDPLTLIKNIIKIIGRMMQTCKNRNDILIAGIKYLYTYAKINLREFIKSQTSDFRRQDRETINSIVEILNKGSDMLMNQLLIAVKHFQVC